MAAPNQLHSVFKLIKAEYDDRIAKDLQQQADFIMEETNEDEEMKSQVGELDDLPLLKRLSSEMQVDPYNRVSSLVIAIDILEKLIKKCKNDEQIPEHPLIRTRATKDQFKLALKNLLDMCIVKNLEIQLLTE